MNTQTFTLFVSLEALPKTPCVCLALAGLGDVPVFIAADANETLATCSPLCNALDDGSWIDVVAVCGDSGVVSGVVGRRHRNAVGWRVAWLFDGWPHADVTG